MAGGGGPGPSEPGFLDTPTYTLALLLLFFLVVSISFEWGTHWLIKWFRRRKRNGLAQAVVNLMGELTLVGLVSLLLIALQGPISSICSECSASCPACILHEYCRQRLPRQQQRRCDAPDRHPLSSNLQCPTTLATTTRGA